MANLNIAITIDIKQAETELNKFKAMLGGVTQNLRDFKKAIGFGDETVKETQKLSKSIQGMEKDIKQVTQTTKEISKTAKEGFSGLRGEIEKTQTAFVGLQWNLKSILTDALTLMNFQLRWYAARQIVFSVPRAIGAGISFEAEIDKAKAQLLRYSAMEGEVKDIHVQVVNEITTYARQLAINLPIAFEEVIKSADRLLAAGADIDTVRASLESFAKLQVAFPEIQMEKFTTAIIGFLNTFRTTPGLRELENDAERLKVILDKITTALAVGVIAPRDINVIIQHLGQMSQAAGFSIDQMLALSVMITNLGSKAGPAARALRGLIDSLASTKGIENLEKIGVHLDRNRTLAEQFKTIIEGLRKAIGTGTESLTLGGMEFLRGIAPTERRSALIALIRELETYDELVNRISTSQGALDRTSAVMTDTLSGQWQIFKNLIKEIGAALTNSELLKDGLGFLIDTLKVLGYWLSGIVGILSLAVDGFKWLYHSIRQITNPLERVIASLMYLATGNLKEALAELKRMPEVYYFHEEKAKESLKGSLERAAEETKTIQDVLFGKSQFTGGKGKIKGGGMAGEGVPQTEEVDKHALSIITQTYKNQLEIYKDYLTELDKLHESEIATINAKNSEKEEVERHSTVMLQMNLDEQKWILDKFYNEDIMDAEGYYKRKQELLDTSLQNELQIIRDGLARQLDLMTKKYQNAEDKWMELADIRDKIFNELSQQLPISMTPFLIDEQWDELYKAVPEKFKPLVKMLTDVLRNYNNQMLAVSTTQDKLIDQMGNESVKAFNKETEVIQKNTFELMKNSYEEQVAIALQPYKHQQFVIEKQNEYNKLMIEANELAGNWYQAETLKIELLRGEAKLAQNAIDMQIVETREDIKRLEKQKTLEEFEKQRLQNLKDSIPILEKVRGATEELNKLREADAQLKLRQELRGKGYEQAKAEMMEIAAYSEAQKQLATGVFGLMDIGEGQDKYSKQIEQFQTMFLIRNATMVDAMNKELELMRSRNESEIAMEEYKNAKIAEINDAANAYTLQQEYLLQGQKAQMMGAYIQLAAGAAQAFLSFSDNNAKAQFIIAKGLAVAMAIVQAHVTAISAAAAVAGTPFMGPTLAAAAYSKWMTIGYINAAIIAATAIGQIAASNKGGVGGIGGGGGGGGGATEKPEYKYWSYEQSEYGTGWRPGTGQPAQQNTYNIYQISGDIYSQDSDAFEKKVNQSVQKDIKYRGNTADVIDRYVVRR
jgi:TP901 family phage tail tape measure protein